MNDFKGIIVSGEPVQTKHLVEAGLIKEPYNCQHPAEYIRPNDEGKVHCALCGFIFPES